MLLLSIAASTEFYFVITESLIGSFSLEGHFSEGKEKKGELRFLFFFFLKDHGFNYEFLLFT